MSTSHNAFLPPDLRKLIDADRHAADPSEEVRQDVARRVDRALGLGGAMLVVPPTIDRWDVAPQATPSVPPPAVVGIAAWKIAVGVGLLALAGGAALTLGVRQASGPAIPDRATASLAAAPVAMAGPAPTAEPLSLDLDAPAEARMASSKEAVTERPRPAKVVDRLADERKVLDRARSALVRRDASEALSALRSHERSFPKGQLVEEREGMRVQALVLAHDFGSARVVGERFKKSHARSVFLPVVDKALESAK